MYFFIQQCTEILKIFCAATQSKKMVERDCYEVYKNNGIFKDFVNLLLLYYQYKQNQA